MQRLAYLLLHRRLARPLTLRKAQVLHHLFPQSDRLERLEQRRRVGVQVAEQQALEVLNADSC
jgi:hypothetical protein